MISTKYENSLSDLIAKNIKNIKTQKFLNFKNAAQMKGNIIFLV